MATADPSIYYSLILGVLITAAYAFSNLSVETVSDRVSSILGKPYKGALERSDRPHEADRTEACDPIPKPSLNWWTDEEIFQLERRAIFSKSWLFVTHAGNFRIAGDYRSYEVAGFSFIVILGKDKQIRAFHNVCRHRAYAVTNKQCGSSTVLRCRYHGWSYDSKGKLIKAPEFENVKGFDKDLNGLWEIKTEIRESMIFVNLDAGNDVTSQVLFDVETDLRRWKINHMIHIEEWKIKGNFNWKLAAGSLLRRQSKKKGLSAMFPFQQSEEYLDVFCTTIFRRLYSGQVLTLRLLPLSKNSTMVECNLYGSDAKMSPESIGNLKTEVKLAIQEHDHLQNRLVHDGLQISDPRQQILGNLLRRHKNAEASLGVEIHPAARKQSFTEDGREDDELCRELDDDMSRDVSICSANASGLLDW